MLFLVWSNGFQISATTFVVLMLQHLELLLVLGVGLQDGGGVHMLNAVLVKVGYLVREEQTVDALVLIIRTNGNEQQVEVLHFLSLESSP